MVIEARIEPQVNPNDSPTKQLLKRYEHALQVKDQWKSIFEECYEYALPQNESFYSEQPGRRRTEKIFDETAVVGVQEFASRLQSGIVPNYARWADFVAGSEVPDEEADEINNKLDEVTEYIFEVIQTSNFAQEIHECFIDLALGTAVLAVTEGDAVNPIRFHSIPLPHVVLDTGPDGGVDHVYRERELKYQDLPVAYRNGSFTAKTLDKITNYPESKCKILEVSCKLYDKPNEERYLYMVIECGDKEMILQEEYSGVGSNPFIAFRWSKASGEIYGRGPAVNALSAIKSANLTIELVLENAQMAISGIYQMDDDGVINVCLLYTSPSPRDVEESRMPSSA